MGNKLHKEKAAPAKKASAKKAPAKKAKKTQKACGAKTRTGSPCKKEAGWGTDHLGRGRCKLHGGSSTGPKSKEGKERVAQNARKHGAYIDKVLNEEEKEVYDFLHSSTVETYKLDERNPIHMATLHRACVTYLKLMRLDVWEMEREFEPYLADSGGTDAEGDPLLKSKPIYNEKGEKIGADVGRTRQIRWSKNTPPWDTHFQNYIKMLGVDRSSEIKREETKGTVQAAVDAFAWLWGQKTEEGSA